MANKPHKFINFLALSATVCIFASGCSVRINSLTRATAATTTAGPTPTLVFNVIPGDSVAGTAFAPALEVQAEISAGVVDTSFTGAVTLSLAFAGDLLGTLSGTLTQNAVAGVATFSNLSINYAATNYFLKATASGTTSVVSNSFAITGGTPTQIAFGKVVTDRPVGSCTGPFTVYSKDAFGNPSPVGGASTVMLSSATTAPGSGTFYSDSTCAAPIVATTIQVASFNSDPFYFAGTIDGVFNLEADGAIAGLPLTTEDITVTPVAADTWIANTADHILSLRAYQSATWTGSEMLIWGGNNSSAELNTGGRYNPASDSWGAAISMAGAPSARSGHTAIWTGTEMIIYGGPSTLTTGGRYNPATDLWGAAIVGPSRGNHSAVWTGTEMIVWGGADGIANESNTGARYNPTTNTWGVAPSTTSAPSARTMHSAVWTGTEMIIWGGSILTVPLDTGGRYDPATDTWGTAISTTGAPTARHSHSAVWTGTEMIIWGGFEAGTYVRVDTGKRYDPATDTWGAATSTVGAAEARDAHDAVWTGTEMIVWGGYNSNSEYMNTGGRYDPSTDTWGAAIRDSGTPMSRFAHSAIWTGTEMIIWGGDTVGGGFNVSDVVNTGGRYNPSTNAWGAEMTTVGAPSPRAHHSAVWTGTLMIVWGGADYSGPYFDTGGIYDPATDTWETPPAVAPDARTRHSAIWTGTEMIIWGGFSTSMGGLTNTGFRYDPATNIWGAATSMGGAIPSARADHTAVWDGDHMIVWGGDVGGGDTATGAYYLPLTDSWIGATSSTIDTPTPRHGHSAIWTGTEMIIWGGDDSGGTPTGTGGRYTFGTDAWAGISGLNNPSAARMEHSAVWTGSMMMIWGGHNNTITPPIFDTGAFYIP